MPPVQDNRGDSFESQYYADKFGDWECNDANAPIDPPHVMLMAGLILMFVCGCTALGLLFDTAPAMAIKGLLMWGGVAGVILGMVLTVASIYFDERRTPPVPPSAPE